MIDDKNYVTIVGWMAKLGIKGNSLLCYALIYGFCQDGGVFNGSLSYVSEWLGTTKRGTIAILDSLIEKGLIEKETKTFNGVKFCEYKTLIPGEVNGMQKTSPLLKKLHQGSEKTSIGIEKTSPNIDIYNSIDITREEKVSKDTSKKFDFKAALLSLDIPEDVVDDFLAVRRSKKATNTKTAFNILKEEINKSQHTATSIVKFCIGKNWMGFKVSYLKPEDYAELEKRPDYRPNYPRPIFPDEDPALKYLRMAKEAEEQRCREMQK